MINYALLCDKGHSFDAWFRNSTDFDAQAERGLISCPVCESTSISKGLMSPNVATARGKAKAREDLQRQAAAQKQATQAAPAPAAQPTPEASTPVPANVGAGAPPPETEGTTLSLNTERMKELSEAIRQFRKHVTESAENVGDKFVEEARKMHYGETEERGIYGQASLDETRELLDEGIDVLPLPALPEDRN
ncbi:DUF1178 family protein [Pseudovibrio sp. SPO723]|uniref:DUF1178 family protein n=1 Tax=Nesiotobacter zosterae TaxID=392721 RepID=UPI0029C40980|nr:DUF1178 family protein [Pseudovibrio sp. SPO723]MDX5594860.1 DUF1178 family protein [Pseudovibrio sp. SPO723]